MIYYKSKAKKLPFYAAALLQSLSKQIASEVMSNK